MSKLSFRARALDAAKPLPIYRAVEIPDTADCSLINRAVPQMPTGMEKEEEAEHHLQQAIVAGIVIPTPEIFAIESDYYDKFYPETYKLPRQLIYMQPFSMENDIPDYDMDSEDEQWVTSQSSKLELTPGKFEEMMDRFEKQSGQRVVEIHEAKAFIKEDDDLIIAVYDYWLNKRLKSQQPLIPHVKTEAKHGVANHNPYVAFRRRTEKMQTRKNRKNDESSYEKMLKLKRDLLRAVTLLEMVKKREKSKRELLHLTIEVFEKRTQAGDFSGQVVAEALQQRPVRPAFTPLFQANSYNWKDDALLASLGRKERRQYKKRRHKSSSKSHGAAGFHYANAQGLSLDGEVASSEDDLLPASPSDAEEEEEGIYAFRRKRNCEYQAPLDTPDGPYYNKDEIVQRFKFYPISLPDGKGGYRSIGPCRKRVGRGGRIMLDRMTIQDLRQLCQVMKYNHPYSPSSPPGTSSSGKPVSQPTSSTQSSLKIKQEVLDYTEDFSDVDLGCWHHFQPQSPDPLDTGEWLTSFKSERASEEPVVEEPEESIFDLPSHSIPLLEPSYHLGLVLSEGDRPLTYPLESLLTDPSLSQASLPSHTETRSGRVVLDETTAELENTYYLMEFNNDFLSTGMEVDSDPLFTSMDVDAGEEAAKPRTPSTTEGEEPREPSNSPGPPGPPPAGSTTLGPNEPHNSVPESSSSQGSNSSQPQPQSHQQQPNNSSPPETTVVNVKSGEETDGGKGETDASKSREMNRFALLQICV